MASAECNYEIVVPATALPAKIVNAMAAQTGGNKLGVMCVMRRDRSRIGDNAVAYQFGRVAAGQAEATFTPQPRNEWDICAGVALVVAAGGRCTNRLGEDYVFNRANPLVDGVCATNGRVHADILGLMTS